MLVLLCSAFCGGFCDDFSTMPLGFEVSSFESDKNCVSENGVFAFGFLEMDNDEYVVGIKYNLADKASNLPVWAIGGGIRVSLNSTFGLSMDGNLILMNPSRIVQWSSNTSTLGVQKVGLLNNGNLVLLSSKDEIVWESFGSPTNTLLPNQSLHYPQTLRAPSTKSTSSYYSFAISRAGELKLVWEHNVTYWRSHFSSPAIVKEARFDSSGVLGLYDENDKVVWSITAKDYGDSSVNLRHLRIDRDGNLRIYSWDSVSYTWKAVWQAVQDQCDVFGFCGLYSVCGYNSSGPVCNCLYSDPLEQGVESSGAGGAGCRKMVDLGNCRMHTSILVMKQTVLYGLYPSHDVGMLLSQTDCRDYCSNDTSCVAATSRNDGSGLCMIKRTTFISGYNTPFTPAVTFLKVCSVPQAVAAQGANRHGNEGSISSSGGLIAKKGSGKKLMLAIALIILLTVTVILSIQILVFWILYRRRKIKVKTRIPFGRDQMNQHYSVLIRLSFEEIKELTNNFANQLGTSVFKGGLPNKTPIVAKVLKNVVVSEKEFRVTVSTLSGTHHRNLASVKGFCFDSTNKILLYEYVPNGSLDKWLFKTDHSERIWHQRIDIALGVAHGVAYLHTECQKCIIHGNLKLENILLDENLVPKMTDFGLQDLITGRKSVSSSESPSERDIYMLGQIFLQIVTCEREILGENVEQILEQLDESRAGDYMEAIERIVRISFWCMQNKPFLRPSIGEVVKVLEGTLSVDRPPSGLPVRHDSMIDTEVASEIEEE
ncbi:hypothetical protein BUALT_Bualt02G0013600 [Buddleja alternifolia]|uniref:Receptor-like serine/threonine-protein kinase n=1 Tax=Buddleja alternifolia TaxID=168488 RepID=A0AAV6XY51_9LAMI|nr:hypothetical protein BUALT_Bualt02G0013600 [Buddleja alternifolia]